QPALERHSSRVAGRVPAQDQLPGAAVARHRGERPGLPGRAARQPAQPVDPGPVQQLRQRGVELLPLHGPARYRRYRVSGMPTPDQIETTIKSYVAALTNRDKDAFLNCFADDAVQIDPYPNAANKGRDAIGGFWDQQIGMAEALQFDITEQVIAGDRAAVAWQIMLTAAGNK